MDSITQAVLGASISGALLGRTHGRKAYLAGAVLATLPDLDVLIRHDNPLSAMINHRGFSHSVFVLTALAGLLAWLIRRYRPAPGCGPARVFMALWLTLVTHPLLDAFTSYGTQLFWPLRPVPTSWSTIFIIDPLYTTPLLIASLAGLIAGARPRSLRITYWGLALSSAYLALSVGAKALIEQRVQQQLAQEGVTVQAMFSTPEPFSILLWRVAARSDDDDYIEVISGLLDTGPAETLRQPINARLLRGAPALPWLSGLQWFTGNWLRYDEIDGQLIASDLRMGLAAGMYSFRFRVAQRDPQGSWQAVTPSRWPSARASQALPAVIRRAWSASPPLPLAQWAKAMSADP